MFLPAQYEFFCPVKTNSGNRALEHLPVELDALNARKPRSGVQRMCRSTSWGSGREYGFCGSLLALGRSDARCDHFGRDARLESVKVFGEFALALDHRDPRPSDLGVFATILGISRDD